MSSEKIIFSLELELFPQERYIKEVRITIESESSIISSFLALQSQNDYFGLDLSFDFSAIPQALRSFLTAFKQYRDQAGEKEEMSFLALMPIDGLFFERLLDIGFQTTHNGRKLKAEVNDSPYAIKLTFSKDLQRIVLDSADTGLFIQTTGGGYIIDGAKIKPLPAILSQDKLKELFTTGSLDADYEMRVRLFEAAAKRPEAVGRYFELPSIERFSGEKILFHLEKPDKEEFLIEAFFMVPSKDGYLQYPLLFNEIRKMLLMQETLMVPFQEGMVYLARPDQPFYEKVKRVLEVVQNCFFEFLNELSGNQIRTKDQETLFQKFFPAVLPYIELHEGRSEVEIVHEAFSGKQLEVVPVERKEEGKMDWFEVRFQFKIQDVLLTLSELSHLLKEGFIQKNGKLISIPAEEASLLQDYLGSMRLKKEHDKALVSRYQLPFLAREGVSLKLPAGLEGLSEDLDAATASRKALREVDLPPTLEKILRNYQKTGIFWLHFLNRYGFGGILADEMGLGKTIQVLTFLLTIKGSGTSIIICPTALVYNWVSEIRKFIGLELSYLVIDGGREERASRIKRALDFDILITSYPLVHNDSELYQGVVFNYCILDEAQHIKNKKAKRTLSIKEINARNRIAMTGTPLENNVGELWSIFDFLMPEYLGSHPWFKKNIESPLEAFDVKEKVKAQNKLKSAIKPFILRRTKSVVLKELPPKVEQDIELELTEKQKALYLETLSKIRDSYFKAVETKGFEKTYMDFLTALMRLRQVCLHPGLFNPELMGVDDVSIKLKALMELVLESIDSGHRIVIFSQFVEMLKIIRRELYTEEIEYLYLDGQTKNRVGLVEHFNNSDIPVFLISLKAGGVGLNLIGADSVLLFDPWWNPAVEDQAIDRVHRIGQVNMVNVYRLITKGTIEEKIKQLQGKKKEVFDDLISNNQSFIKSMKIEDVKDLLEMK